MTSVLSTISAPALRFGLGRGRLLFPSLADFLFIAWIVWVFVLGQSGWAALLADGDTGWHIRTGEWIIDSGSVPRADLYSFSKPGGAWYAWEWLADVVYAFAFRWQGLKGVVLLAGVLISAFGVLLVRWMMWRGSNLLVALALGYLAFGASSVHFLARPHVFTQVLLVVTMWLVDRDRKGRTATVWLVVPLAALWTNLHGGFVALVASLAVLGAGDALETFTTARAGARTWRGPLRTALLCAGTGAASIANPYGLELHRHIFEYLRANWIRDSVQEFQSPVFRSENMLHYEILLVLGLMSAAALLARRSFGPAALIVLWAHHSLVSARHIPIYVIVAAPLIATEVTGLWRRLSSHATRRSVVGILDQFSADVGAGFRRVSIWPAVFVGLLAGGAAPGEWPHDFPPDKFPVALIQRHAELISSSRVYANDEWADYLLYRFYPRQRVFFDGRSDYYGPNLMTDYISAYQGKYEWEDVLDSYRCDVVLVPPDAPLASLLKTNRGWRVVEDDGRGILFERRVAVRKRMFRAAS